MPFAALAAPQRNGAQPLTSCTFAAGSFEKLFAKVTPDDCSWTLDGEHIVITLEKAVAGRPWAGLVPLGSE